MEYILIGVGVIAIFILCRELICWYFRLSAIESLLTDIRDSLKKKK